jgi:intracellular multiplication protein IcmE
MNQPLQGGESQHPAILNQTEHQADVGNPHIQMDSENQPEDIKHLSMHQKRNDADGFAEWNERDPASSKINDDKTDVDEFSFKDEPLYPVQIDKNNTPNLADDKSNMRDLNGSLKTKANHAEVSSPEEGQVIDLGDLNQPDSATQAEIEQQVEYALTQKETFLQRHLKKVVLCGIAVFGGGIAVALANFKTTKVTTVAQTTTVEQVAVPDTDKSKWVQPSQAEKQQRNLIDQQQAQDALANGQTYTPEFVPEGLQPAQLMPPPPPPTVAPIAPPPQMAVQPEQTLPPPPPPPADALSSEEVDKVRNSVYSQVESLVASSNGRNGFNTVIYSKPSKEPNQQQFANNQQAGQSNPANETSDGAKKCAKNCRAIAGRMMYATLNQPVNSDDGQGAVFATFHGGPFNGGMLLGRVETAPNNIRITFSQISMPDGETIPISAMAIREKDARSGMAENINHHTVSRYSYLFVSSFIKGLSDLAKPRTVTTFLGQNTTKESQEPPETKDLVRAGFGDAGKAMSEEAKERFNRPPTYTIPQNQAFAVLFLENVK